MGVKHASSSEWLSFVCPVNTWVNGVDDSGEAGGTGAQRVFYGAENAVPTITESNFRHVVVVALFADLGFP